MKLNTVKLQDTFKHLFFFANWGLFVRANVLRTATLGQHKATANVGCNPIHSHIRVVEINYSRYRVNLIVK